MPEHERRKVQVARLLATVSVLGLSVGMFRPAHAAELTPSQQDKWSPTAQSGATEQDKWGASSPQLDAASKDAATHPDSVGATITHSSGDTEQFKLDTFTGGVHPGDELGSGGGAGKSTLMPPGTADYMKYDSRHDKLELPAVQNKADQPDAIYHKEFAPNLTVPGAGTTQPK